MLLRAATLFGTTTLAGCVPSTSDGVQQSDDFFTHRAYTSWGALPSRDGSQLALLLEPRRVDAVTDGGATGWRGQVAGESLMKMVVGPFPGIVVGTMPRAFHHVEHDRSTLFVWALDAAEWSPVAPNDPPPPARYASVTWFERATFYAQGARKFEPPLEHPMLLGATTLLDGPREGASEVARPVRIAVHDYATGAEEVLFADRGFDVATCVGDARVTIAYQPESSVRKTVIVDVTFDASENRSRLARRDVDELAPRAVVCRAGVSAIVGTRTKSTTLRTVVVHAEPNADELVLDLDVEAGGQCALSKDGTTLLAQREDGSATLLSASDEKHIADVRPALPAVVSGDRAWLSTADGAYVVRLDGKAPTAVKVSNAAPDDVLVWAAGEDTLLAFETKHENVHYTHATTRVFLMRDGGPTDIAMPAYSDPYVAYADDKRAYVVGNLGLEADVVTIDLAARAISGTVPFPLCDRTAMRELGRCMP